LGPPDTSSWYCLVARYSSSLGQIILNVNGTNYQDSAPWTGGVVYDGDPFSVFAPSTGTDNGSAHPIDAIGYWKRALTDAEVQRVYDYGHIYGQGFPWGNQTNNTVVFLGSARYLYDLPLLQDNFINLNWVQAHKARVETVIAMYV